MPKMRSPRRPRAKNTSVGNARGRNRNAIARGESALPAAPAETKPVRGVKLSTVSNLTMLFALICLAAFAAGRPPAAAAGAQVISRANGRAVERVETREHQAHVAGKSRASYHGKDGN
jgi:hypothetical protein